MLLLALATVGCGGTVVDDAWEGGVYFAIPGPVDVDVATIGATPRAAVAWAWQIHGHIDGRVEGVGFEPRVYSYALEIEHPPVIEAGAGEPVSWSGWEGAGLLVGLPLLYRFDGDPPELEVVPQELFAWLSGTQTDATAVVRPAEGFEDVVAAVTRDHLLIGLVGETAPGPAGHGAPCGLDEGVPGLTLYRRGDAPCDPWEPLALPGERTEFQGVSMGDPALP